MRTVKIWFDGGFNQYGMYGSFRAELVPSGEVVDTINRLRFESHNGVHSCNVAEYLSLRLALDRLLAAGDQSETTLEIWSDSEIVVRQINGTYKNKTPHLRALCAEVRMLLGQFAGYKIKWHGRENNVLVLGH